MPALRRPCTPRLTEAASRSAATSSGGSVAASASACSRTASGCDAATRSRAVGPFGQRMLRHSRSITSEMVVPSARAEKLSAMRWRNTGWRQRHDIVDRRRQPALDQCPGAHRQHEGLAGARARAPGDEVLQGRIAAIVRARRAHQFQDRLDNLLAHRQAAHDRLCRHQIVGRAHRGDGAFLRRTVVDSSICRSASWSG